MNRNLLTGLLVLGLATVASAAVTNGDFSAGLSGWTTAGGIGTISGNPFGMPTSPSGDASAGVISSWGGDWGPPLGSISQVITGLAGTQTLSGEVYGGAHAGDPWRNVIIDVLWNGSSVYNQNVAADPVKWAADFSWANFSVPVTATGNDTLRVDFYIHFAEWSWTGVDNLAVTPEPTSLLLLGLGLPLLRRRR